MKRIGTGICVAAALGCMATLGAQTPQTPPTSTEQRSATSDKARDISVTGCLAKGSDGRYMLNNAKMDSPSSSSTAAGTSTTAGTTGTTSNPAGTTPSTSGMNAGPSLMLTGSGASDSDLEKHVGHKIQVTGKSAWDGSMTRSSGTTGTTGSTTGTPTGGTTTSSADQPRVDVQSVKLIAASCS
jgi:hypothetical protein